MPRNIEELDTKLHGMRIKFRKAHNFFTTLMKDYQEIKAEIDTNDFGNDQFGGRWTTASALALKAGLSETQLCKFGLTLTNTFNDDDRQKMQTVKDADDAEKNAAARARRAAAEQRLVDLKAARAAEHAIKEPPDPPLPADLSAVIRNIRGQAEDDLRELRESLREFGWVAQFPALRDENGMVLVGHRRLKAAAELGIEPVYRNLVLGKGSEADSRRLELALVSNIGFAPLSAKRRKRIAVRLKELGWTQQKISDALRVSQRQISTDLEGATLEPTSNVSEMKDSLGRRRSPGRPRKDDPNRNEEWRRKKVAEHGIPQLQTLLAEGKLPVATCERIAGMPTEVQAAEIDKALGSKNVRAHPGRKRQPVAMPEVDRLREHFRPIVETGGSVYQVAAQLGATKRSVEKAEGLELGRIEGLKEAAMQQLSKKLGGKIGAHTCICGICGEAMPRRCTN